MLIALQLTRKITIQNPNAGSWGTSRCVGNATSDEMGLATYAMKFALKEHLLCSGPGGAGVGIATSPRRGEPPPA